MTREETVITVAGEALYADPLGALYWPQQEMLIVSDIHFEKGSAFATRGVLLPPYDTRTTLRRLGTLIKRYKPRRTLSLGDAFHDVDAEHRMEEDDCEQLAALLRQTDWIWILGNHDPVPPKRFAALTEETLRLGQLTFRHEPISGAAPGEVAGHLHPCARIAHEGRVLRRRCFASDGARLIMPALGAYTGGLNILDEAYESLFSGPTAWVMGESGVYPIGPDLLVPDTQTGAKKSA